MGKKLTTWEKNRREKEKKEKAAASRAETAARRKKEREQKEKLANLQSDLGNAIVKLYSVFIKYLGNLTLTVDIKKISVQESLELPNSISFKNPGDLNYIELKSPLIGTKFKPNKALNELKKNEKMSYDEYKADYGTFLGNLFGKTKSEYETFIKRASFDLNQIMEMEEKRKVDFEMALSKFETELELFNKLAHEEIEVLNRERVLQFDEVQIKISDFNEDLVRFKAKVDNTLKSLPMEDFLSLFGIGLPIVLSDLDSTFSELVRVVKEFNKVTFNTPSKGIKYGLCVNKEKYELAILYDEDYFPIPFEKQINSVKGGYSVQPLTKSNRDYIVKNLIPGLALIYAAYAFNTLKKVNDVILRIGVSCKDKKTGGRMISWSHNLFIERSKFISINFKNIEPCETIDLFTTSPVSFDQEKIHWFNEKNKTNLFLEEIIELGRKREDIVRRIESFNRIEFVKELPDHLKNLQARIEKIRG